LLQRGARSTAQPGLTSTSFEENITKPDQLPSIYDSVRASMEALMRKRVETGDAPEIVADTVLKAATDTAPRRRYTAGKLARQIRIMRRFLPESVVDKNARKYNNLPV
jgi:hypothetical protein